MIDENPYHKMRKEMKAAGNVPWQAAAVLAGLVIGVPCAGGGTWGYWSAKGYGSRELALGFAVPGYLTIVWGMLGVFSRLRQANRNGEATGPIRKKLIGGVALVSGTIAIGATLSIMMDMPMAIIAMIGMLPMGFGALLITWSMVPPKKRPEYAPLGIAPASTASSATSVIPTTAATSVTQHPTLPPRPRMK